MFTPVLTKHTKNFNLVDTLSVGVDRIQWNFEPLQRQVELWRKTQITDDTAKLIFCSAFIDGKLEAPRSLLPRGSPAVLRAAISGVLGQDHVELSNAFTSAFKKLDPVPQFKATAKLGGFLASCRRSQGWPVQGWLLSRTGPACLSNFLEGRFWPTSGLPTNRPESLLSAKRPRPRKPSNRLLFDLFSDIKDSSIF